jgi:hypothetical protein
MRRLLAVVVILLATALGWPAQADILIGTSCPRTPRLVWPPWDPERP